mgnify:CR=1 FL=1
MYEELVNEIIEGRRLGKEDDLTFLIDGDLESLCQGADKIRKELCGNQVDLCTIINGRAGRCSENCRFCAQSSHHHTGAEEYDVMDVDSFVKASLYIILILTLASSFGVDAASIVALLGSAGVAVGLAVQGSLSNLAGGVLILLLKPFKVGDYIVEGSSGKEGTVKEIQIFYTKLLTYDNQTIILPNGNLANNTIVNVTAAESRRCDVKVSVAYSADIKKAKEVLTKVLSEDPDTIKEREHFVFVDELADSGINLCVRCWFKNEDFWQGKWRITEQCKYALDKAEIEIPFPQMDVHMR